MKDAVLACYPWDLEDEGLEPALGRIAGELGADTLSVGASLPAIVEFRPRPTTGPRTVRHEAGVHFQPDSSCYAATRIRPVPAPWMKSRNPLEPIAKVAGKNRLRLRAVAHGLVNRPLSQRHPLATCVDVFGDPLPDRLCPSNPDVREYLVALVADLTTNYPLDVLELASFCFPPATAHDADVGVGLVLNPVAERLRRWCFCPACRERATATGLDARDVAARASELIRRAAALETIDFPSFNEFLRRDECVAAYHRTRLESVASLVRTLRPRPPARLALRISRSEEIDDLDVPGLRSACDHVIIGPCAAGELIAPRGPDSFVARAGGADRTGLLLLAFPPHVPDGPSLVTAVHQASQAGHATIGFTNYGETPEPCLDWIRQAVRYARRESSP